MQVISSIRPQYRDRMVDRLMREPRFAFGE